MFTNADAHDAALPLFRAVLADKERRLGSRMTAYDRLASRLGRSPSWVRKIVRGEPDAVLELRDWLNISAAYDRLCARVAAAAEHEEARAAALEEILHEAGGAGEALVERTAPPAGCGTGARRQAGARVVAAPLEPRAAARGHRSAEAVSRG